MTDILWGVVALFVAAIMGIVLLFTCALVVAIWRAMKRKGSTKAAPVENKIGVVSTHTVDRAGKVLVDKMGLDRPLAISIVACLLENGFIIREKN